MENDKQRLKLGFNGEFKEKEVVLEDGDPAPWDPSTKFSIVGTRVPRLPGFVRWIWDGALAGSINLRSPSAWASRTLPSF